MNGRKLTGARGELAEPCSPPAHFVCHVNTLGLSCRILGDPQATGRPCGVSYTQDSTRWTRSFNSGLQRGRHHRRAASKGVSSTLNSYDWCATNCSRGAGLSGPAAVGASAQTGAAHTMITPLVSLGSMPSQLGAFTFQQGSA